MEKGSTGQGWATGKGGNQPPPGLYHGDGSRAETDFGGGDNQKGGRDHSQKLLAVT